MTMRVLHVSPAFYPATRYGGPIVTLMGFCAAEMKAGVEVTVATTDANGPGDLQVPIGTPQQVDGFPVLYFHRFPAVDYAFSPGLTDYLRREIARFDLVHITSVFSYPSLIAAQLAHRRSVPYLVSPCGALQRWGLRQSRWKKAAYWHMLEKHGLKNATALHATSEDESDDIRAVLPTARVFTVPNGVDLPEMATASSIARKPQIVFLGRIHPVKGFDVLLPALSMLARQRPDVETVLAGPDNDSEMKNILATARSLDPAPRIRYLGTLAGEAKTAVLSESAALVLPSHSESFGQVVVEAMACGTPVVVSRNCPWRSVETRGAGRWVENRPEQVATALAEILGNPSMAARMGQAGRQLAGEFAWSAIGERMALEYSSLLKRN